MYTVKDGYGNHSRVVNGVRVAIKPGQQFTPTKKELESFGDKFIEFDLYNKNVQETKDNKQNTQKTSIKINKENNNIINKNENINTNEIPEPKDLGGGWYEVGDTKIKGKKKAYIKWEQLNDRQA